MNDIKVGCETATDGWRCRVTVSAEAGSTTHDVSVTTTDALDLAAATTTDAVERLVFETFDFLLEREPQESILRSFDITVAERYFPDYRYEIQSRLAP
jgi:hypothetical protein